MLLPKRVKYRRVQRGRMTGKATRGNTITYGEYGLQATEPAWITSNLDLILFVKKYIKTNSRWCLLRLCQIVGKVFTDFTRNKRC